MIECNCTNEALRELYAKTAKERDELADQVRQLHKLANGQAAEIARLQNAAYWRDEWRSAEDSPPEPGERVLVDNGGMVLECYRKMHHGVLEWCRMGMPENWLKPKYWRPLPAPHEKE